jgi:hypothetical protein
MEPGAGTVGRSVFRILAGRKIGAESVARGSVPYA